MAQRREGAERVVPLVAVPRGVDRRPEAKREVAVPRVFGVGHVVGQRAQVELVRQARRELQRVQSARVVPRGSGERRPAADG
eukprot:1387047-Pleurochrysis_carterae.AAC.3